MTDETLTAPPADENKGKAREREPTGKDLRDKVVAEKEAAEKKKEIRHCPKNALTLESASTSPYGRGQWYARVPHEHTIEDVLAPTYFGLFQSDEGGLLPGDIIDVEPESALWNFKLRVMAKSPKLQQVKTREVVNTRQHYGVKTPNGVRFEWRGESAKWVIVKGDVDVDAGFDSQEEALTRYEELAKDKSA